MRGLENLSRADFFGREGVGAQLPRCPAGDIVRVVDELKNHSRLYNPLGLSSEKIYRFQKSISEKIYKIQKSIFSHFLGSIRGFGSKTTNLPSEKQKPRYESF